MSNDSSVNLAGYAIYRSYENVVVLTETMRQGPDELAFLQRLLHICNRFEGILPMSEQANFTHDRVLILMETWNEVNAENHTKLANLGVPVAMIPSKCHGKHHSLLDKQLCQIVLRSLIAVGSTVLLTKNQ